MKTNCPKCKHEFDVSMPCRTTKQNDMYWGLIIPALVEHTGYFPNEMHEELKLMFNPKDSKLCPGKRYGGTTTTMTTKEFILYCEQIRFWAFINHGIDIPEIDENEKEKNNS